MIILRKDIAVVLCGAFSAAVAYAQPLGPAYPGNEAVKIVSGKRVVELPPMTETTKRYVKNGGKPQPPSATSEVFMIEGPDRLMECRSIYLSETGCVPSTLGRTKRPRFWTVKTAGVWKHCESRAAASKCEPATAGVPGGMGSVE